MSPPDHSSRLLRLERALAGSRDGHWERDLRSGEIWYSPSFYELFQIAEQDLPGTRGAATARIHPDDQARFRAAYEAALTTLGDFDYEVRARHGDGSWRWVHGRGRVWPGDDGKPRYLCGTMSDVHREKIAQIALEQRRERLEQEVGERTARLEAGPMPSICPTRWPRRCAA
ncbi:MAG: PAS domain-containing protein [Burkholderiales bacterium]|nr:PAS domain-containing protein [Burkholderiales bacterium]